MVEGLGEGSGTGLKGGCVVCNLFQAKIDKGWLRRDTARPQHCRGLLRDFVQGFAVSVKEEMKQAAVIWGNGWVCTGPAAK